MINTYIFDFDGTLVDSMPAFVASVIDTLEKHNVPYEKNKLVCDVTPLGADGTAQYLIDLGINMTKEELLCVLRDHSMGAYLNTIPEKPNAKRLLESLKSQGARIYMLTANSHIQIDPCLKRLGMYECFSEIWSCDDLDMSKTDTKIYDKVAEIIDAEKDEILFFDDNPDAIRTAAIAGLHTCAVYDESSRDYIDIMKETAERYVYDLGEILEEKAMTHADRAEELFCRGYNCAQAVAGAFCEELGIPLEKMLRMSAPFGGGIGRQREVCGAVSGMLMMAGLLYGYDIPEEGEHRGECYAMTRELCDAFKDKNGSIICREILGKRAEVGGKPEVRTSEFYKTRPCVKSVRDAAEILKEYISRNK